MRRLAGHGDCQFRGRGSRCPREWREMVDAAGMSKRLGNSSAAKALSWVIENPRAHPSDVDRRLTDWATRERRARSAKAAAAVVALTAAIAMAAQSLRRVFEKGSESNVPKSEDEGAHWARRERLDLMASTMGRGEKRKKQPRL